MSWSHQFDEDMAVRRGIVSAVVYEKIRQWVRYNAANDQNYRDGRYWTYNSVKAWQKQLPFFTEKQIRTALDDLRTDLVMTGHYSSNRFDRSTWYALTDAALALEGKSELPYGADGHALEGKTTTTKRLQDNELPEHPVATLPAKPSPYRVFSDLFEERSGQKWSIDGKKEGANLAALVKWAKEMAPDGWEQYLRSFMDGAWALIHGDVLGLKASEREWWMSKPYTPSMLRSLRPHIVATMLAMESNNTASKEYMEQLEKDWGTKIRKRQALEAK